MCLRRGVWNSTLYLHHFSTPSVSLFLSLLFLPFTRLYHLHFTLGWSVCLFHFSFAFVFSILIFVLSVYLFMMDAPWLTGLTWLRLDVVIFLFLPLSVIYDVFYLGPACLFGRISYRQSMSFRLSYVLLLADLLFCTNSRFSFYPVSLVALVQLFLISWI